MSQLAKIFFTLNAELRSRWCIFFKNPETPMIECRELEGKVVQRCTVDKDAQDGPEIHIAFTDETVFCVSLKSTVSIETQNPSPTGLKLVETKAEDA